MSGYVEKSVFYNLSAIIPKYHILAKMTYIKTKQNQEEVHIEVRLSNLL